MTISISVECDAFGCGRSRNLDADTEGDIEYIGWHCDPVNEGQHYCQKCWPKVKKELESEGY